MMNEVKGYYRTRTARKVDDSLSHQKTTAIRVSSDVYELLRSRAFHERTTIREIADEILTKELDY